MPMYFVESSTNELTHHGVKGMKWGIRKRQYSSGNSSKRKKSSKRSLLSMFKRNKKTSDTQSSSRKTQQEQTKKKVNISELSDDELKKMVTRMQLEQNYRQLNPKQTTIGERIVKAMSDGAISGLQNATQNTVSTFLTNAMKEMMEDSSNKDKKN